MFEVTIQSEFFVATFFIALENHIIVALHVQISRVCFNIDEAIAGRTGCLLFSRNFLTRNAEILATFFQFVFAGVERDTFADVANQLERNLSC